MSPASRRSRRSSLSSMRWSPFSPKARAISRLPTGRGALLDEGQQFVAGRDVALSHRSRCAAASRPLALRPWRPCAWAPPSSWRPWRAWRRVAGVVGRRRGGAFLARTGLGLLAAALGGALGQQRHRLLERQLLGLEVARHGGVDAAVLHVEAVAAVVELDRRLVGRMVADDADRLDGGAAAAGAPWPRPAAPRRGSCRSRARSRRPGSILYLVPCLT